MRRQELLAWRGAHNLEQDLPGLSSPLPPIAEGTAAHTPEHAGRGEQRKRREKIFRPFEMGGITKYLSTSCRCCVIY